MATGASRGAAHDVMKPTVAEYLRQKGTVRGWLQDLDARVILAIDGLQRAAAVSGDLLEIGVSYAILLAIAYKPASGLWSATVLRTLQRPSLEIERTMLGTFNSSGVASLNKIISTFTLRCLTSSPAGPTRLIVIALPLTSA